MAEISDIKAWRAFRLPGLLQNSPFSCGCDECKADLEWTLQPLTGFKRFHYDVLGRNVDDKNPEFNNHKGFWTFKRRSELLRYCTFGGKTPIREVTKNYQKYDLGSPTRRTFNADFYIFSLVRISGDIVEHELGYRSKELEILKLFSFHNNTTRRAIAHKLGWPGKIHKVRVNDRDYYPPQTIQIPEREL